MKQKLISFLLWALRKLGWQLPPASLPISSGVLELLRDARVFTVKHDVQNASQTGEWKRHQVYAALIKCHPGAARKDIALAIELAVRGW